MQVGISPRSTPLPPGAMGGLQELEMFFGSTKRTFEGGFWRLEMRHGRQPAAVGRSKNQPLQTNSSKPSQALGIWESWLCFRLLPPFLSRKIRLAMHPASSGGILGGFLSKHDVLHKLIRWYSFFETCTMPHFVVFLSAAFLFLVIPEEISRNT